MKRPPRIVGWREWVELDGLSARAFRAKLDTGARTSALHASGIELTEVEGAPHVRFFLDRVPQGDQPAHLLPIVGRRLVTSSSGDTQERYVVHARLKIDRMSWPIEVTLTDRSDMRYSMLIGRAALADRLIVDSSQSYVSGHPRRRRKKKRAASKRATPKKDSR